MGGERGAPIGREAKMPTVMSRPDKPCFTCGAFPRFRESSYCEAHYRANMHTRKKALREKRKQEKAAKLEGSAAQ